MSISSIIVRMNLAWRNRRIGYPAQPGLIRLSVVFLSVCLSICLSVMPAD
jgi:hypothetical protein